MGNVVLGAGDGHPEQFAYTDAKHMGSKRMNVNEIATKRAHRIREKMPNLTTEGLRQVGEPVLSANAQDAMWDAARLRKARELVRGRDHRKRNFLSGGEVKPRDIDHETLSTAHSAADEKVNNGGFHAFSRSYFFASRDAQ